MHLRLTCSIPSTALKSSTAGQHSMEHASDVLCVQPVSSDGRQPFEQARLKLARSVRAGACVCVCVCLKQHTDC